MTRARFTAVVLGTLGLGASGAALSGCSLEPAAARPELDAAALFEAVVKPQLVSDCAPCHKSREPFLVEGSEYESITRYKGGLFLTQPPELSYLLHRGEHQGPALSTAQALDVLTWLQAQVAQTAKRVPVTPTVAVGPGEFFLSLKSLVDDPQARITFKIEPLMRSPGDILLSELKLVAGRGSALQVKHPRFILSSGQGVRPDPGDSLSNVELTVNAGDSKDLGSGGVILTEVPPIASLGVAFASIDRVGEQKMATCKALDKWAAGVRPVLAAPCAASCHGGNNSVATNAFDMRGAGNMDPMVQLRLCVDTLARVDQMDVQKSVLIKQPTPAAQGGTQNHPFKLQDPGPFRQAVVDWVTAESKP